ncbi:MAG: hypothetical protein ABJL67_05300 [Sulfitobacter sp.]
MDTDPGPVCLLLLLLLFGGGEALLKMSYISSSGGTCYEKHSLLDKTCQVQIFHHQTMANFEYQETHGKIEYVYTAGFKG